MELVNIVLCTFLLCFTVTAGHSANNDVAVPIQKFPFQISVEVDRIPICGGVILGDQWILTALNCIPQNESAVDRVKIRAGSGKLGSGGALYAVSSMVKFQNYFQPEVLDIGLIKIEVPFVYSSSIQWTRPAIDYLTKGDKIVIAGWGLKGTSSKPPTHKSLKSAKVKVISMDKCSKMYKGKFNFTEGMACLVPVSRLDNACIGDVGSPVMVSGLVSAVVSSNKYCWKKGYPLVVTDIGDAGFFLTYTMAEPILRTG